jgi:hypothetical protein
MKRKLSKNTLRYKISQNSIVALLIISLKRLKKKNKKLELQSKYHYEVLMKELDPRRSYVDEAFKQISIKERV